MKLALCHPYVLPARGGCERYITDLAGRLTADGHEVHLCATRWDAAALPGSLRVHRIPLPADGPRSRRPWLFSAGCLRALRAVAHDVSIGFDKTRGQDVLYPQGGLHRATSDHNLLIPRTGLGRQLAKLRQRLDPAYWSFRRFEQRQYLGRPRSRIIVNSRMVAEHFAHYHGIGADRLHIVPSAIDPARFDPADRDQRRWQTRQRWQVGPEIAVGLFAAMNYALKGLEPLLHALRRLPAQLPFRLVVVGNARTSYYQWLARRLGVAERVRFLGQRDDMADCYFAADFLVHPTFYDPCSLVVLEALACGLPVITSRFNGASELLPSPAAGFIVDDPHDSQALAAGVQRFCQPDVHQRGAAAAREAAARWTWEDHYRSILAILTDTARQRSSRAA